MATKIENRNFQGNGENPSPLESLPVIEGVAEPVTAEMVVRGPAFHRWERYLLVGFALGLIVLLVVARCLPPNPTGMGTHQRLGLPACGSMFLWGVPCPSCGMTTSWAWLTRGQLGHSWNANPGGLSLGLFMMVMAPWMLASGIKGYWWPWDCQTRYVMWAGVAVVVITVVQWLVRIWV